MAILGVAWPPAVPRTRWSGWSVLATVLACAGILFYRKADSLLNPQFWAEEGPVYFMPARILGWHSLLRPYDGNTYLIHRAIAYGASLVPVRYAPAFGNYASLALNLAVLAYIAAGRIDVRRKWLLALVAVCVPHTGEVMVNLVNVHWLPALALLVLALSEPPRTRTGMAAEAVALACLGLDGPFIFLFGPLFLVRALRRRTIYSAVLLAVVGLCMLWQFGLLRWLLPVEGVFAPLYRDRMEKIEGAFNPHDLNWLGFWGNCLSGILLLGRPLTDQFANSPFMAALTVVLLAWLAAYVLLQPSHLGLGLLYALAVSLASVAYLYRANPGFATVSPGFRYSYVPFVCITWILVLMTERSKRMGPVPWALLAVILLSSLTYFQAPPLPDLQWAKRSRCIDGPEPCIIPINPSPWAIYYLPEGYDMKRLPAPGHGS